MLPPLPALPAQVQAPMEPDGARPFGVVPPYRAEPAPPAWLRAASHAVVAPGTRHYVYEAYAGPDGCFLVRYLLLPEAGEACARPERVLRFEGANREPRELAPKTLRLEPRAALAEGRRWVLVDRRDLMKPGSPQ